MQKYTYEEVIETIENKRRFGNLKGVEISAVMLAQLGHPEKDCHVIHIAGTNGKGSVSAFLRSILMEAGYKTGMFTSPHLVDFRERIEVNGHMITKEDAQRIGNDLLAQDFGVSPTMFDYCLAMALLYFKEQACDVVILETGLGGRYDSTNAVGIPDVSVITKIGYDHMEILGNTLAEIAGEKAGIIKTGSSIVLESQEQEALQVLLAEIKEKQIADVKIVEPDKIEMLPMEVEDKSEMLPMDNSRKIEILSMENEDKAAYPSTGKYMQRFSYGNYRNLSMKMLGIHQYENAVAAILAAEAFLKKNGSDGKHISYQKEEMEQDRNQQPDMADSAWIQKVIKKGVANAYWMGRMQLLSSDPFFMIDGAHNSNGVDALRRSLVYLYPGEKFHFIMGVMADKDYEIMIEELLPLAYDFKTVTVESSRALQADELAACIRKKGVPAEAVTTLEEALPDLSISDKEKKIAFGSLYFIGEIEAYYRKK